MASGAFHAARDVGMDGYGSGGELVNVGHCNCASLGSRYLRRAAFAGLGVSALLACGFMILSRSSRLEPKRNVLTGRMLIEDTSDVHRVVAENIINVSDRFFGGAADRNATSIIVEEYLGSVGQRLAAVPDAVHALESVRISGQHKDVVLQMLRLLVDPRLQHIGLDVAHAVRDCACNDPEDMKHHIAQKLAPKKEEMIDLYADIFREPNRGLFEQASGFDHLLTPQRVRRMRTVDDGWKAYFGANSAALRSGFAKVGRNSVNTTASSARRLSPAMEPVLKAEQAVGIVGAVAEEADALLRIIRPICKMFQHDLNVPPVVTSGIGAVDYLLETASCELNAFLDKGNPVELVGCPLEFGSQGFDALREVFALVGILGDNDAKNGKQGNHNGDKTVHWGILA
eukprot:TRINITY_DN10812_c0_g2_i1.p1 TRINITY_DN10812_c0_g2~~TRINITY_DN10812_c0_g2_i1.p1  ORF type:complete len:409 (-),score=77.27 TRINITY_DN10812_c0_g2_i1:162-1361(-)